MCVGWLRVKFSPEAIRGSVTTSTASLRSMSDCAPKPPSTPISEAMLMVTAEGFMECVCTLGTNSTVRAPTAHATSSNCRVRIDVGLSMSQNGFSLSPTKKGLTPPLEVGVEETNII
eukprot:scaffold6281_cov149-Isochrysis_galbana.AAC.7